MPSSESHYNDCRSLRLINTTLSAPLVIKVTCYDKRVGVSVQVGLTYLSRGKSVSATGELPDVFGKPCYSGVSDTLSLNLSGRCAGGQGIRHSGGIQRLGAYFTHLALLSSTAQHEHFNHSYNGTCICEHEWTASALTHDVYSTFLSNLFCNNS